MFDKFYRSDDLIVDEMPECDCCEKPAIAWIKLFDDDGESDGFWETEFCGLHLLRKFHDAKQSMTTVVKYRKLVMVLAIRKIMKETKSG